jgi:MFS family permease
VLKRVGGKIWVPILVTGFGIISMCTAFVKSYSGLLTARFFLGICEGGVLPGLAYYLSTFYRRRELAFRISIFIEGSSIAGAFGGLLAAGLVQVPDWGVSSMRIHTWRNIFFFEGLVSIIGAGIGFLILPNSPLAAGFLTERQKHIASERMIREVKDSVMENVGMKHIKQAFKHPHTALCAFMFFFLNIALASLSVFLPTILKDLGYTSIQAQFRSVAPYSAACAVGIAMAWTSDRVGRRGPFIVGCSLLSAVGYAVLCASDNATAKYVAIFIAAVGSFSAGPIVVSWSLNNSAGPAVRSVTSAYVVAVGNCGGLLATWTYLPFMAPEYTLGHALNLTSVSCAAILAASAIFWCHRENRRRERGERDSILQGKSELEVKTLGHLHPDFRFIR